MSTRFSSADAAWLHMDRPTNLMVINSLSLFEQPVDWARVIEITRHRLIDRYPRFRQKAVESRLPLRPPKWVEDPDFAIEHHMHHLALPAPGDKAVLQELISDLITTPLDRSRPLWHTYMIDGYGEGAAMLSRMHHCIADGIALARLMLSLTDSEPDAGIAPADDIDEARPPAGFLSDVTDTSAELVRGALRLGGGALKQGVSVVSSPSHAASLAGAVGRDASTLMRLLLTPSDAATAIKGDPGISRRVAWGHPIPLERIRRIARANDATVNDVVLAAVSGALRHYLHERGSHVGEIQAVVPFNLRPLDQPIPRKLGNKFGLVFLPLPVGTSGSYRRLVEVHKRMEELKSGREGAVTYGLLSVTGMTPEPLERRVIDLFTGKGTAVMTNVPGPREPVYVAGTPIRTCLFWAPTSGHIGMSVSIFSYRGEVTVGLMVDAALIPDPDEIVTQLEREVFALSGLELARRRRSPRRRRADDAERVRSKQQEPSGA